MRVSHGWDAGEESLGGGGWTRPTEREVEARNCGQAARYAAAQDRAAQGFQIRSTHSAARPGGEYWRRAKDWRGDCGSGGAGRACATTGTDQTSAASRWGRAQRCSTMGLGGARAVERAPGKLDGFPNTACRLGTPGAVEGGVESAGRSKQETTVKAPGSGLVGVQASRVEFGIKSQVKSW